MTSIINFFKNPTTGVVIGKVLQATVAISIIVLSMNIIPVPAGENPSKDYYIAAMLLSVSIASVVLIGARKSLNWAAVRFDK